jgi:hypothetical protein
MDAQCVVPAMFFYSRASITLLVHAHCSVKAAHACLYSLTLAAYALCIDKPHALSLSYNLATHE